MLLSQIIAKDLVVTRKDENRYVALCPWHKDSHPSLQIHNGKNLFKCFVCGKGGKGAIQYIMQSRNISRIEALNLLKKDYESLDLEENEIKQEELEYLLPLSRFKKPTFEHYLHGFPTNIYEYRNLQGQLLGYTCRYSIENNGKVEASFSEFINSGCKNGSPPDKHNLFAPKYTISSIICFISDTLVSFT